MYRPRLVTCFYYQGAAGIVDSLQSLSGQQCHLHLFPPCDFVDREYIQACAPELGKALANTNSSGQLPVKSFPYMLAVLCLAQHSQPSLSENAGLLM